MGALPVLATNHIDLDGSVHHALLLLGLSLLDDLLGDEDLLDDLPCGGNVIVQQDAGGKTPAHEEHHNGHDDHHHLGALRLGARLVARHVQLRDERQQTEQDQGEQVRQSLGKPTGKGLGGRHDEVGQDVEKGEALLSSTGEVMTEVAQEVE